MFRLPREHSVTGILTLSLALSMVNASDYAHAPLVALAYLTHLSTFDYAFTSATRRDVGRVALAFLVNAAPYAPAIALRGAPLLPYLAPPAALAATQFILAARGATRSIPGVVVGAAMLSSTSIAWSGVLGGPILDPLLYTLYTVSSALYVESRLAFRSVNPLAPLAAWVPAVALAATSPLHLIAVAEPTAKLVANAARNVKLRDARSIKRMGIAEVARSALFTALVAAAPN